MWEKFKIKCKSFFSNRAAVIITVMVILTVTALVTVTVALNRAKKPSVNPSTEVTDAQTDAPRKSADTDSKTDSADVYRSENTVASVIGDGDGKSVPTDSNPKYVVPVSGSVAKEHDASIQVWSATTGDYRVHLGIDIATENAAPVCAVADGTVTKIWDDPMMGVCVALTHAGETCTVYKNLSANLASGISEGASVKSGQTLGKVGSSAVSELADEPHLHFEMTVNGIEVDPLDYFEDNAFPEDTVFEDTVTAETSVNEETSAKSGK